MDSRGEILVDVADESVDPRIVPGVVAPEIDVRRARPEQIGRERNDVVRERGDRDDVDPVVVLPMMNKAGYDRGSPLTYVSGFRGNLLLVHGSGDDNVHYQNSEMLINALVAADKPFTMMEYPNRTHCICQGRNTQLHLFELKGTGDFSPLEPVAHAYRAGDEEDDIEYAVADMRALQRRCGGARR